MRGVFYVGLGDDRYYCCPALLASERRPLLMSLLCKQGTVSSKSMLGTRPALITLLRAQEVFFSDSRSGQVVDERIRPALESGYAVGSTKPVLVVIDEIDGATGDNVGHKFFVSRANCRVSSRHMDSLTNSYTSPTRKPASPAARKG